MRGWKGEPFPFLPTDKVKQEGQLFIGGVGNPEERGGGWSKVISRGEEPCGHILITIDLTGGGPNPSLTPNPLVKL